MKMNLKRKKPETTKLNLIPILDAVFIFIFFLLMSAQFVEIYKIESEVPQVADMEQKNKDIPLNLILEISKNKILVKSGPNENVYKSLKYSNNKQFHDGLNKIMINLKSNNIEEDVVILRPEKNVAYKEIVKIIDYISQTSTKELVSGKNKQGKVIKTSSLFNKIVFETVI
jgi:biopolymer transport protein ExbD